MIEIEWCGHISHVIACSESEEVCFKNVRLKKTNNTKTPERHFTMIAYYSFHGIRAAFDQVGKLLARPFTFFKTNSYQFCFYQAT